MGAKRRVDGEPDLRSQPARLTKEQRAERNEFIMTCYIAGRTETWISKHPKVRLTQPNVHRVITEELKQAAKRHGLASDHAMTIYVERLDLLWGRLAPKIMDTDPEHATIQLKAIESGRRLLESYARLYDLVEERSPMIPPLSDSELDAVDEESPAFDGLDELTKFRLRSNRKEFG